jgi:hypothetical protein
MKTIVPFSFFKLSSLLIAVLLSLNSFSQTIPELVFSNPVLVSGVAGQNGAKYRFNNVCTGLDAVIEIKDRSSASVVISSIDSTGIGWNKAFQPVVGIPGTVGANQEWWMDFRIEFYEAGTNTKKRIENFFITSLDVDGDGQAMNEWVILKKVKAVTYSLTTTLSNTLLATLFDILDWDNCGQDVRIDGPVTNYANIDTSAVNVMATYEFEKKERFEFRMGGKNGNANSSAGMRMNSFWFKQFELNPLVSLPLNLIDFNATLNKSKVDLKWTTAGEKDLSHFELERSVDGSNFSQAALIFAYGNTNEKKTYPFSDNISNVQSGIIYYRLRSVDEDGKSQLSQVRIIRLGKQNELLNLIVYPNPAGDELRISVPAAWQNKEVRLEVFNQNGQRLKSFRNGNANQTEVLAINDLPTGFYFLKAISGNEKAEQKFIKK